MNPEVQSLIDHFQMTNLPVEGTLYTRTWLSSQQIAPGDPAGSAIIALYADDPWSASTFHRLTIDEVWHFYGGDPLRLILLHPDASSEDVIMGSDPLKGQRVQFVVPAGVWQAGHLVPGGRYALFGCTMAPGFTPACFEGGTYDQLIGQWPDRAADLRLLGCVGETLRMPPATP
jgi:predicted cupin superfamily sugar epimerase